MKQETRTYTITTSPDVQKRIEKFLALLHWNSRYGHSGTFAMPLDGDGQDTVTVDPEPGYSKQVGNLATVGYDVEIAYDNSFSGLFENTARERERECKWVYKDD